MNSPMEEETEGKALYRLKFQFNPTSVGNLSSYMKNLKSSIEETSETMKSIYDKSSVLEKKFVNSLKLKN
jgi:hypothetical protein